MAKPCSYWGIGHISVANYPQKPRLLPEGLPDEAAMRLSFCCSAEGCRKRTTPGSVRFAGRRLWLAALVLVLCGDIGGSRLPEGVRNLPVRTLRRMEKIAKPDDEQVSRTQARARFNQKETRSYEAENPGDLWHLDGHKAKCRVLGDNGAWIKPVAIAYIDDHSRLICHVQWFDSAENTRWLVHCFSQAAQKRGLPRRRMSDNGSAMTSAEFTGGLERLSVSQEFTIAYTPEHNGKIERWWATMETGLMAMLENRKTLTLTELNNATQGLG